MFSNAFQLSFFKNLVGNEKHPTLEAFHSLGIYKLADHRITA